MNNFANEEMVGPASQMICSVADDANDFQTSCADTAAALHECDGHDPFPQMQVWSQDSRVPA